MCKYNSPINKLFDAKNLKVSVRFIHTFALREKKAARQLPTGAHLEEIMNSKIISNSNMKKERADLRVCNLKFTSKLPVGCHGQPKLAQFTHLWLGISANADCSSAARAVSRKG